MPRSCANYLVSYVPLLSLATLPITAKSGSRGNWNNICPSNSENKEMMRTESHPNGIRVVEPKSEAELVAHYQIRYNTLRKPWGKPPGSEREGPETDNILALALDSEGIAVGTARLLPLEHGIGQIRSMGVEEAARGQGVGRALLHFLETKALKISINQIILHARENAVPFYEAAGYRIVRPSYSLWELIPHFEMEKSIQNMRDED